MKKWKKTPVKRFFALQAFLWEIYSVFKVYAHIIERNVAVVQEIASKLGEHLADTQFLLESIAQCYRPKTTPVASNGEEEKS